MYREIWYSGTNTEIALYGSVERFYDETYGEYLKVDATLQLPYPSQFTTNGDINFEVFVCKDANSYQDYYLIYSGYLQEGVELTSFTTNLTNQYTYGAINIDSNFYFIVRLGYEDSVEGYYKSSSDEFLFSTLYASPILASPIITNITDTSAVISVDVLGTGGGIFCSCIGYREKGNTTITWVPEDYHLGNGTSALTNYSLTNLEPNTTYEVIGWAENNDPDGRLGTDYSDYDPNWVTFATSSPTFPPSGSISAVQISNDTIQYTVSLSSNGGIDTILSTYVVLQTVDGTVIDSKEYNDLFDWSFPITNTFKFNIDTIGLNTICEVLVWFTNTAGSSSFYSTITIQDMSTPTVGLPIHISLNGQSFQNCSNIQISVNGNSFKALTAAALKVFSQEV